MLEWLFVLVLVAVGLQITAITGLPSPASLDYFTKTKTFAEPFIQQSGLSDVSHLIDLQRTHKKLDINFLLFTPANPTIPCYIDNVNTARTFSACKFNPSLPTKFIMHGYDTNLTHHSIFFKMKDAILLRDRCNVILTNYTKYSRPPYFEAVVNSVFVSKDVASLVKFLMVQTGIQAQNIHLIGHSLGAHISGFVGKQIPNIGRITGKDPAYPSFNAQYPWFRLTYTDAIFVDVIHTSSMRTGLGMWQPIGHQDFYPNGGHQQRHCYKGNNFEDTEGTNNSVDGVGNSMVCNHDIATKYFTESINDRSCRFLATECSSYGSFQRGSCSKRSSVFAVMGYRATPIPGLPPLTKFYLNTNVESDYCNPGGHQVDGSYFLGLSQIKL